VVVVVGAAVVLGDVSGGSWARAGPASDAANAARLATSALSERDRHDIGCRGYRPSTENRSHWARVRDCQAWVTAPFSAPVTRRANLASTPDV
jgi:hypothetical protein